MPESLRWTIVPCGGVGGKRNRRRPANRKSGSVSRAARQGVRRRSKLVLHSRERVRLSEIQQLLPQANASAKYARLHGRDCNTKRLSELAIRPAFCFLQDERVLQRRVQPMKCLSREFFAHVEALWILAAVFDLGKGATFVVGSVRLVIVGNAFGVAFAQLH